MTRTRGRGRVDMARNHSACAAPRPRVGSALPMPWIVALLRGQKVLARASGDGSLAAEGGRVEIRYRKTDPRAYRAAASNLTVVSGEPLVADDEVVPGADPTKAPAPERLDKSP